jgi:hypothetical protein
MTLPPEPPAPGATAANARVFGRSAADGMADARAGVSATSVIRDYRAI